MTSKVRGEDRVGGMSLARGEEKVGVASRSGGTCSKGGGRSTCAVHRIRRGGQNKKKGSSTAGIGENIRNKTGRP